jgi:NtrC-family two-component system sensor histidine kinase KinB
MIYHDLRSPLANIVTSLDILSSLLPQTENEAIYSVMNIAHRSTDRIQRLISSLIDINRLETGQVIVSQQAIAPVKLAEDALVAVRPVTESRHQELSCHIAEELSPVWVDVDMLSRVLINLLENASKFSPPESKIELGGEQEGDWVKLWVQDNGPGIPFSEQDHVFEKYSRLDRQDKSSGLGVGLAFCRLAVNGHGGKIWIESEVGRGSKFILTLPVAKSK